MKTTFLILTLLTVFISAAPAKEHNELVIPDLDIEVAAQALQHSQKVDGEESLGEPTLVFDNDSESVKPVAMVYSEYSETVVDELENIWEPTESSYLVSSVPVKACAKDQIKLALSQKTTTDSLDMLITNQCD